MDNVHRKNSAEILWDPEAINESFIVPLKDSDELSTETGTLMQHGISNKAFESFTNIDQDQLIRTTGSS